MTKEQRLSNLTDRYIKVKGDMQFTMQAMAEALTAQDAVEVLTQQTVLLDQIAELFTVGDKLRALAKEAVDELRTAKENE